MTAAERGGFLSRWSRRKIEAREGQAQAEENQPDDERPSSDVASDLTPDASLDLSPTERVSDEGAAAPEAEPPPPTLQDVHALTRDSDFSPFVTNRVAPEVKNAALKKLFSDPHYNVMDGLDIYIDDYSNLEPLPAPMLRQMASAHALKMFDALDADSEGQPTALASASETSNVVDDGGAEQLSAKPGTPAAPSAASEAPLSDPDGTDPAPSTPEPSR